MVVVTSPVSTPVDGLPIVDFPGVAPASFYLGGLLVGRRAPAVPRLRVLRLVDLRSPMLVKVAHD